MKFALLIYESPDAFASRKGHGSNAYTGAWRAYHKALVESDVFVGGDPLEVPETGTTIKIKDGKRGVHRPPRTVLSRCVRSLPKPGAGSWNEWK